MNSHETIKDELIALNSSLSSVEKPVFSVPDGYFENFAATVLSKIEESKAAAPDSELSSYSPLRDISRQMPYFVPENYFTSLSDEIPALISNDPLPSILQEAGKNNAYGVPPDYFATLPEEIRRKVPMAAPAKVVSIGRRSWLRIAAAAVLTGALALGSFVYFSQGDQPSPGKASWVAAELKDVSDEALEEFVQTADVTPDGPSTGTARSAANLRSLFKDVSDSELDQFLAEVPTDDDELIMIN